MLLYLYLQYNKWLSLSSQWSSLSTTNLKPYLVRQVSICFAFISFSILFISTISQPCSSSSSFNTSVISAYSFSKCTIGIIIRCRPTPELAEVIQSIRILYSFGCGICLGIFPIHFAPVLNFRLSFVCNLFHCRHRVLCVLTSYPEGSN